MTKGNSRFLDATTERAATATTKATAMAMADPTLRCRMTNKKS
jgi:hypothetical protein